MLEVVPGAGVAEIGAGRVYVSLFVTEALARRVGSDNGGTFLVVDRGSNRNKMDIAL